VLTRAGSHQFKFGVDLDWLYYWQDLRRTGYEHYRLDGTRLHQVVFGGTGLLDRSNFEVSSYFQDAWKVRPSLLLEAGLRQDWDQILRNTNISPRLGISWKPPGLENTKISGGYALIYEATNLILFTRPLDQ